MKKILLLGGSAQQIIAIKTAKKLNYYTILCDYLPDNPGRYHADIYYQESTVDKQKILSIAKKECIDGIVAYASDPAAPTAAYVAEKLGLPTNPYESVNILCNKALFREFLRDNGFCVPKSKGYSCLSEVNNKNMFNLPVIVKPVDSSGSKGITVVYNWDCLIEAVNFAVQYSRSKRFIIEEYIEKKHKYLIGGDIFVHNGKIILKGLMNCHRDSNVNSLVPVGKSYPLATKPCDEEKVYECLKRLIKELKITNGAMNVESIIDKDGNVFLIDIGPRNGGNMIPDLLGYIYGIDVVELTLRVAMGEVFDINIKSGEKYWATYNLHSDRDGELDKIIFDKNIEEKIVRKEIYKKRGEKVYYFDNASKSIGVIFMKFGSKDEMLKSIDLIENNMRIITK